MKSQSKRNNHTDVIRWENHHGLGKKDSESAYRDEFNFEGGFSMPRRQEARKSSKTLLEWSKHTASKAPVSTAVVVEDVTAPLRYQNDYPLAGSPTKMAGRESVPSVRLTERSIEQLHRPKPFGVDESDSAGVVAGAGDSSSGGGGSNSNSNSAGKKTQIMSLAETMKAKRAASMSLKGSLAQRNV